MIADAYLPVALVVGLLLTVRTIFRKDIHSIGPSDAQALLQTGQVIVLDVREPQETKGGHLPGALFIPLSQLAQRLAEVPRGRILVYCARGMRSRTAAAWLRRAGHLDVLSLEGGFTAWTEVGYPLGRCRPVTE